jgi:hypothetical protein
LRTVLALNAQEVFWPEDGSIVRMPREGGTPRPLIKLASPYVQGMVADETSVYWTDRGVGDTTWSGRVYRVTLQDGTRTTISDAPDPFGIAVDGEMVYWTSRQAPQSRILGQKKSGGPTFVLARSKRRHGLAYSQDTLATTVSGRTARRADPQSLAARHHDALNEVNRAV